MTGPSRRQAVAGLAALIVARPASATTGEEDALRAALDTLPPRDPAAALAALARFDPHRLPLSPRLDLLSVRAGLEIDRRLDAFSGRAVAIADLPATDRASYYQLLLNRRLGTITLDDARAQLAAALSDVTGRADRALAAMGLTGDGVADRLTRLIADPRYHYPDTDAGREQAVADMNRALAARRAQLPAAFIDVPPWCLDVGVAGGWRPGDPAGKRVLPEPGKPGRYIVDLKDIARRPSWTLGSVVAHELLPGHLLQLPIEVAASMHPARADYAVAFVEGWAIYAEQLAAEQGAFADDAPALVGHLHWLLFRVARAQADIGIHVDGWSAERALAYLEAHQGPAAYFAPYDVELRRLTAEPAVRAGEGLAWLAIAARAPADWRRRRRFHAAMLAGGRKRREQLSR